MSVTPPAPSLSRYELLRKIGSGGMAEVWLARRRGPAGFEKELVLKRMLPHLARRKDMVDAFLAEARLAASLRHPHVVDVYEVGEDEGAYFIAMEYLPGRNLRQIEHAAVEHGQRHISPEIAAAIIAGAARGLHHAHHRKGSDGRLLPIVHRDVSPQNVVLTFEGVVKIVDFGIALAADAGVVEEHGIVKGKLRYMSPEQIQGLALDGASDQFSLALVLYELVAGAHPIAIDADDSEVARAIADARLPAPREVARDFPPALEPIVLRALAAAPGDRWPDCSALAHELDRFVTEWHREHCDDQGRPTAGHTHAEPEALGEFLHGLFPDERAPDESAWLSSAPTAVTATAGSPDATHVAPIGAPPPSTEAPTRAVRAAPPIPPGDAAVAPSNVERELLSHASGVEEALMRGRREAWIERMLALLSAGGSRGPAVEGPARLALGRAWRIGGEMTKAEEQYGIAVDLARRLGDERLGAQAEAERAIALRNQGRVEEARDCARRAIPVLRRVGDEIGAQVAIGNLGVALVVEERHEQGQHVLTRAARALAHGGGALFAARFLAWIAISEHAIGRIEEARHGFQRALKLLRAFGDERFGAWTLGHYAWLLQEQGDLAQAARFHDTALARLAIHRATVLEGDVRTRAGFLALEEHRSEAARRNFLAAFELAREDGEPRARAIACAGLAAAEAQLGHASAAHEAIGRARAILGNVRAPSLRIAIDLLEGVVEAHGGHTAAAHARMFADHSGADGRDAFVRCARRLLTRALEGVAAPG